MIDDAFRLRTELCGVAVGILTFRIDDNLEEVCRDFVAAQRLKELFLAPLETHVAMMLHMDKREDDVDIIDLI